MNFILGFFAGIGIAEVTGGLYRIAFGIYLYRKEGRYPLSGWVDGKVPWLVRKLIKTKNNPPHNLI